MKETFSPQKICERIYIFLNSQEGKTEPGGNSTLENKSGENAGTSPEVERCSDDDSSSEESDGKQHSFQTFNLLQISNGIYKLILLFCYSTFCEI